ncbi:nicotinate-nucleotide pyrophosphorylase [Candidatus Methanoplasma termitum]|uniref:Nicotinate-nucleotide pyrophosphorylase [carboxylating] n=2 Tax=Candidatus Methanoplasma termitum TaxID=1577791 RepID=A0A0A7LI32_9ARCH|nr:nicotinate-nucleotide pyrophosphorylase [Candidatus Methanoplasma termitum]
MDLRPFLDEDVGSGDITTEMFVPDILGKAVIMCEEDAVIAGLEEAAEIFRLLGADSEQLVVDGERVRKDTDVMIVEGPLRSILTGERVALNFLMRMSGIATETNSIMTKVRERDKHLMIAGTRKTTPGFRAFEKKAIALGGGWPHRNGLYDMILIKDNHILACGGVSKAMERTSNVPDGIKVEIEVTNITDGIVAAKMGADIIMADHMSPSETKELMKKTKLIHKDILIEASGNITKDNVMDFAGCADIVSLGSLTHSPKAVHFSLDLK